ncbi:molybdate ABC transporter substrate-binding protein [Acinetobacter beijerinckii]|uniref:Molybdate ABC transporter, periplasmic molybdate-binding protein n=1 Tax=Acinetobacter beijerinckii ANC 3835 TaxID=1217649 RepID=N9DWM9_9GAMM|nr:molybdate ABC transporter substrate-binding protein [Acinetobacter beijerinckii]ENW02608.1 molybdate ABC transporter, periplasmic molybdate-binding protein [Acinetobacter beijerinckii ANC 3835]
MIQKYRYALAICVGLFSYTQAFAVDKVTVYAAASLTNAINELDVIYEQKNKVQIKTSYAGSSTLAKQIEADAPADIFISADVQWMDYLQNKQLVSTNDRVNLLSNRLVVIAPKARPIKLKIDKSFDFTQVAQGKWCTGDTKSVPVGKYAKQALTSIGWWDKVSTRLVETEDVRAALNFVARGECQLGIVYATDAAISKNVVIVGTFPENTHQPIIYPIGLVKKNTESMKFYKFLKSSQAIKVFKKYGFSVLK